MKRHARQVGRSRLMARPMSRLEWIAALLRGPDYEGGWLRYLAERERRP